MRSFAAAVLLSLLGCFGARTPRSPGVADTPQALRDTSEVYFEFQVQKTVSPLQGSNKLIYPRDLRIAHTEGSVLVQFVVDREGRPEMASFKVLKSDHGQFSDAVRTYVAGIHFSPAEMNGRKVRQLVQQPFHFTLSP